MRRVIADGSLPSLGDHMPQLRLMLRTGRNPKAKLAAYWRNKLYRTGWVVSRALSSYAISRAQSATVASVLDSVFTDEIADVMKASREAFVDLVELDPPLAVDTFRRWRDEVSLRAGKELYKAFGELGWTAPRRPRDQPVAKSARNFDLDLYLTEK